MQQLRPTNMQLGCRISPRQPLRLLHNGQQQQPPRPTAALPTGLLQHRVPHRSSSSSSRHLSIAAAARASSAQPMGDVALGAGRAASALIQSITNPKEDKDLKKKKKKWQKEKDAEEAEKAKQEEAAAESELQQKLVDPLEVPLAGELQQQQQLEAAAAGAVAHAEAAGADAVEAVAAAATAAQAQAAVLQQQQGQQQAGVVVSEYTEELVEVEPKTMQQRVTEARAFLTTTNVGKGLGGVAVLLLGGTLAVALYRTWQKYSSPRAQRMRVIDKNKLLVEELSKYLPGRRSELTPGVVRKLRGATGFTPVEVFRKYLWFLLRERQFDADAVEDMVLLKGALGLSDKEVADALKERSQRIYDKYGTLMLNTEGMTAEGLERKATCRALFGKLLYLTEHEPLVAAGSEAFKVTDLRTIFGATDEDVDKLRIVSLYSFDMERMENMVAGGPDAAEPGAGPPPATSRGDQGSGPQQQPQQGG